MKISVSLLSADFGNLKEEIEKITEASADLLHLDIMDGHFVPNLTFGMPIIKAISRIAKIPLDAHLMVTNPDFYIEPLSDIGVKYISFHTETVIHSHRLVEKIKIKNIQAGIAINPGTDVHSLDSLLPILDFVLIMSVNPGFGGQKFLEFCLNKVYYLDKYRKDKDYNYKIEIDGGVDNTNIKPITEACVDIAVAGAYIFKNEYDKAIYNLHYPR